MTKIKTKMKEINDLTTTQESTLAKLAEAEQEGLIITTTSTIIVITITITTTTTILKK